VLSYVRQITIFPITTPATTSTNTLTVIIIRITTSSGLALMGSDYPQFLLEAARVLKIGGRFKSLRCILTSISHPLVLLVLNLHSLHCRRICLLLRSRQRQAAACRGILANRKRKRLFGHSSGAISASQPTCTCPAVFFNFIAVYRFQSGRQKAGDVLPVTFDVRACDV
jgi:hypothetical protein